MGWLIIFMTEGNKVVKDKVVEILLEYRPEAAISGGLLLQSEDDGVLIFNAMKKQEDGYWSEAGTGILEFKWLAKTKFGLPNDEALAGHPLYKAGLDKIGYGFAEVTESSWLREEEQNNQVKFPKSSFQRLRHFIVMFHDSTFECLAEDLELVVSDAPRNEIIARCIEKIY